jgi:hypothetical protein
MKSMFHDIMENLVVGEDGETLFWGDTASHDDFSDENV